MYRIYLADDNDLFRESLIQTIHWEELGCSLVGNARDGETAGKEISELEPDIVLLDIRMPGMSGLELASLLKSRGFDGRIIIITGYSDFAYAQKSIRIGVFDYLLKPIDDSELESVIRKAMADLDEKRERRVESHFAGLTERKSEATATKEIESMLQRALSGDEEVLEEMNRAVNAQICYTRYELFRISPDRPDLVAGQSVEVWNRYVRGLLDTRRNDSFTVYYASHDNAMFALVLFRKFDDAKDYDIEAVRLANQAYEKSVEENSDVCISISRCHESLGNLQDALREAAFSYDSRFFIENRHIIHYNSLKSNSMSNIYPIMQKVEEFYGLLRSNPKEIGKSLDEIEIMFHAGGYFDLPVLRNILGNMAIMINMMLAEYGEEEEGASLNVGNIVLEMDAVGTLDEAFRILRKYAVKIVVQAQESAEDTNGTVTTKIMSYLEAHYAEHIGLQDACDYVGLSRGHVSRLLKSATGESFVTLLNRIRIEKAREMLATHEYKVYEVAEATGFSNYAYFYQAYKKYTGLSPKST